MIFLRKRLAFSLLLASFVVFVCVFSLSSVLRNVVVDRVNAGLNHHEEPPPPPPPLPRHPIYKPPPQRHESIVDNFPLAARARSPTDLPPIPSWNQPPIPHVNEKTPLFIGFTRNWPLLQQTVVSYVTAGWPPEDIYVVENTGTMNSNKNGNLSWHNPFYIDHRRLTKVFGVNVLSTPTLFTFAQLQNFYLHTAIERDWPTYFWGHMDVVALPSEDFGPPFRSLYMRAVDTLRECLDPGYAVDEQGRRGRWAIRFFAYDRLALVNRAAFEEVGGWDTMIPYYGTDCDMHERLTMAGFKQENAQNGLIYDVATSLDDLIVLYRRRRPHAAQLDGRPHSEERSNALEERGSVSELWNNTLSQSSKWPPEDRLASPAWAELRDTLDRMQTAKANDEAGRNVWHRVQAGGQGEPYYRDAAGFEQAFVMWIEHGKAVMAEKWGHWGCDLRGVGLGKGDEWRVEHDWDRPLAE